MYDASDPRSTLAAAPKAAKAASTFAGAEYGLFYEQQPQDRSAEASTWYSRGQNFIIGFSEAKQGATFTRDNQPDEYVVLLPNKDTAVEISTPTETVKVSGYSIAFVPPGRSTVKVISGGRVVRMFSPRSTDLAAKCGNAASFNEAHPNIPPFQNWPDPPEGFKVRHYSLDVAPQPGRFGRIFRCTTFMVNYLEPRVGPRERDKASPHHHDDFEQGSLALEGTFTHHLRWPWTTNMNVWRDDEHARCGSPSLCVIPPPAIHTSMAEEKGVNQLVDIFAPPRVDFSEKPGWVLNAKDYPMPGAA